jgi:hypothetical protein
VPTSRTIPDANQYPTALHLIEASPAGLFGGSPPRFPLDRTPCVITDLERDLDEDTSYNGIVAVGTGSQLTAPLFTEIWDDNPASPTYYLGRYGKVPYFWTTPLVTTQPQLVDAATSMLKRILGLSEQLHVTIVPNPALEPGDPIEAESVKAGVIGTWVASSLTIPLGASATMPITCRSRQR